MAGRGGCTAVSIELRRQPWVSHGSPRISFVWSSQSVMAEGTGKAAEFDAIVEVSDNPWAKQ